MNKLSMDLEVYGDSYDEIIHKAESEINYFLGTDSPLDELASYEVFVSKDLDMDADFEFKARVVARIKNEPK